MWKWINRLFAATSFGLFIASIKWERLGPWFVCVFAAWLLFLVCSYYYSMWQDIKRKTAELGTPSRPLNRQERTHILFGISVVSLFIVSLFWPRISWLILLDACIWFFYHLHCVSERGRELTEKLFRESAERNESRQRNNQ
jgi:hypothetical protein